LWSKTEMGFVELNKIDCHYTEKPLEYIRKGVEAAQALAEEVTRAAELVFSKQRRPKDTPNPTISERELAKPAKTLTMAHQDTLRALIREMLQEYDL
jgi:broad specificity phosphatase PhoE